MVFKCLVKIKLSLGTSSAATTTTSTTSLERSLLSLLRLRLRRGGATLFVAAAKTKSVNSNCLLLGLPASQGKQRFGHGPLEAWTRYAPLLLLFPLPPCCTAKILWSVALSVKYLPWHCLRLRKY